ncbi:MAG: aminoacetone oxidase family FAD-binding enzyme, partial [Gemmatimonadota bacterium]|nr:aminoacetone oxidase family FAD-binding enzyme [Gemmatimonadota bacterium]
MAAIFAAKSGAETILLERTRDGGRKILISGGGRCNVLPMKLDESRFVTDSSSNTLRKMLRSWPLAQQIAFFENDLNIPLVDEEESSKLFPASHKARDVRDGLLQHADTMGAHIRMNSLVTNVEPIGNSWRVSIEGQAPLNCDAVIIATGGLSVPNTGSDGFGLRLLDQLGHTVHPTYAALTPVVANANDFAELSGVSLTVAIKAQSAEHTAAANGGFLFTHVGYSGPSVLDVSHVLVRARRENESPATLRVQWTALNAEQWETALKPKGARSVTGALRAEMPDRLAAVLIKRANIHPGQPLAELKRDDRLRLIDMLTRGELPWSGDEGYKKAEVTGGGVSLAEVDPRSLESRMHRGLF